MQHERDFKGVFIPKAIWLTPELTAHERLIFMEIYSLDRKFGCVAENGHFAKWLALSERQVQDYIKRLREKALISVQINKAKDTRVIRVIGRYAHVTDEQIMEIGYLRKELAAKWTAKTGRGLARDLAPAGEGHRASSRGKPRYSIDRHMR